MMPADMPASGAPWARARSLGLRSARERLLKHALVLQLRFLILAGGPDFGNDVCARSLGGGGATGTT